MSLAGRLLNKVKNSTSKLCAQKKCFQISPMAYIEPLVKGGGVKQ